MSEEQELRERVAALEAQVATQEKQVERMKREKHVARMRGVRSRSGQILLGLPLYDIALGPDPEKGEIRGRAHGILAIGDIATGVVAIGGVAAGFLALGGVAFGAICTGGVALGLLFGVGGLATGGVAIGGLAIGYYAVGGNAIGEHILSSARQDPAAVEFFRGLAARIPVMESVSRDPH